MDFSKRSLSTQESKVVLALTGDAHAVTIRIVSGSMTLLPLKDVDQLWESGRKPQLISEDTVCDYSRL